ISNNHTLNSFEVSLDNRIIALARKNNEFQSKYFYLTSSKMDFHEGCDFKSNSLPYVTEHTIHAEEKTMDMLWRELKVEHMEIPVSNTTLIWEELCASSCEVDPPAPPITIVPEWDWRYRFEASGELDPSITSIYWSINGQLVGEGPATEHAFEVAGKHTICLTIRTACGEKTVCREVNIPNRRNWMDRSDIKVKAWPNPVMDQLNISLDNQRLQKLAVYNSIGQRLQLNWEMEGAQRVVIQTTSLIPGQYIVELLNQNGQVETVKFTK
ncbi:MAG: T9SS type A sorting domain-containing protein, partial [Bacteroidota bacterium]